MTPEDFRVIRRRADGQWYWRPRALAQRAGMMADRGLGRSAEPDRRKLERLDAEAGALIESVGQYHIAEPERSPRHPLDGRPLVAQVCVGGLWTISRGGRPVAIRMLRCEMMEMLRRHGGVVMSDEGAL